MIVVMHGDTAAHCIAKSPALCDALGPALGAPRLPCAEWFGGSSIVTTQRRPLDPHHVPISSYRQRASDRVDRVRGLNFFPQPCMGGLWNLSQPSYLCAFDAASASCIVLSILFLDFVGS